MKRFYQVSRGLPLQPDRVRDVGTKHPYLRRAHRGGPARTKVLDYGCGIGSDGLALLEAGYEVELSPTSTTPVRRYLRWRLEQRGLKAMIHDLDAGPPPADAFALAFAFDVIEHVDDPRDSWHRWSAAPASSS